MASFEFPVKNSVIDDEKVAFDKVFDTVLDIACEGSTMLDGNNNPGQHFDQALTWFKDLLRYNFTSSPTKMGLLVVHTYKTLIGTTAEGLDKARMLGWALELFNAVFWMTDDIIDDSDERFYKPCWHKLPSAGPVAINDCVFLLNAHRRLLKAFFKDHDFYFDLVELFEDAKRTIIIGQNLDFHSKVKNNATASDVARFTQELFESTARCKTAIHFCYLPVAIAMIATGYGNPEDLEEIKCVSLKVGHFVQIRRDYLDCYSSSDKSRLDIQDGRCTWLIVKALQLANSQQRLILEENYGKQSKESTDEVIQVYEEVEIKKLYQELERDFTGALNALIHDNVTRLCKDKFIAVTEFVLDSL